jgi:hypothetical protein
MLSIGAGCGGCLLSNVGPDGGNCAVTFYDTFKVCIEAAREVIGLVTDAVIPSDSDNREASGPVDPNEKLVAAERFIEPSFSSTRSTMRISAMSKHKMCSSPTC